MPPEQENPPLENSQITHMRHLLTQITHILQHSGSPVEVGCHFVAVCATIRAPFWLHPQARFPPNPDSLAAVLFLPFNPLARDPDFCKICTRQRQLHVGNSITPPPLDTKKSRDMTRWDLMNCKKMRFRSREDVAVDLWKEEHH